MSKFPNNSMGAGSLAQPKPNFGPEFGKMNPTGNLGAPYVERGPSYSDSKPVGSVERPDTLNNKPDGASY